jgi:hypothetical protein
MWVVGAMLSCASQNYRVDGLIHEINISEGTHNDAIPSGSLRTDGFFLHGSLTHASD